jgi:hypothetical protein
MLFLRHGEGLFHGFSPALHIVMLIDSLGQVNLTAAE